MLPAFNFHSIGLEPSQFLQTDLTLKRKCYNDYCFRLVLFIFPIMFARVLRNKSKRVKSFFGCIIFLLTITKPNFLTKNDILKSNSEIFTYESIDLNWLPISDRINQRIFSTTFKFVNDMGPNYLHEVFQWAAESNRTLRNDYLKLKHPFHKTTAGQNSLSFLGPSKWNKLPESTKKCNNINTFKHNFKKLYLAQLAN